MAKSKAARRRAASKRHASTTASENDALKPRISIKKSPTSIIQPDDKKKKKNKNKTRSSDAVVPIPIVDLATPPVSDDDRSAPMPPPPPPTPHGPPNLTAPSHMKPQKLSQPPTTKQTQLSSDVSARTPNPSRKHSAPHAPSPPPVEPTILTETVVSPNGASHVLVTTVERHPTVVLCPCEGSCGALVRIGKYARHARSGTPVCPHCRACLGSEHGFSSYAQLVVHVNTKTCRAMQARGKIISPARRKHASNLVSRINSKACRLVKDGVEWFLCFCCGAEVRYNNRYKHCLMCVEK